MHKKKINNLIGFYEEYVTHILPLAEKKINYTENKAREIKDFLKRKVALNTIRIKKKHIIGSSIFCSLTRISNLNMALDFFTGEAFLLDYLDNVIEDDSYNLSGAKKVHQVMLNPILLKRTKNVKISKSLDLHYCLCLSDIASRGFDGAYIGGDTSLCIQAMSDFIRSQVYSCLPQEKRKQYFQYWYRNSSAVVKSQKYFEHEIIQASPLRCYALASLLFQPKYSILEARKVDKLYYWMGGINAFGDQVLDYNDDIENDEVNNLRNYKNMDEAKEGYREFIKSAFKCLRDVNNGDFHYFVFLSLLAMYVKPLLNNSKWSDFAKETLLIYETKDIINKMDSIYE